MTDLITCLKSISLYTGYQIGSEFLDPLSYHFEVVVE